MMPSEGERGGRPSTSSCFGSMPSGMVRVLATTRLAHSTITGVIGSGHPMSWLTAIASTCPSATITRNATTRWRFP